MLRIFCLRYYGFLALVGLIIMPLSSCQEKKSPPPQPSVEVTAFKLTPQKLPIVLEFAAETEGYRVVDVRARVEGILLKQFFTDGSFVREGDLLFQIDPRPFEARLLKAKADRAETKATFLNAQKNFERMKKLLPTKAVSQKDFDDAQAQLLTTAATLEAAQATVIQAELDLEYTEVRASLTGLTSLANQNEGSLVSPTTNGLLTTITQLDPLNVNFGISDKEWLDFQKNNVSLLDNPNATATISLADGSLYPVPGRINFFDSSMNGQTGTFRVRAVFPNTQKLLKSGQFVRIQINCGDKPNALVIPRRALSQSPKGTFVFIKTAENKAEMRPIEGKDWGNNLFLITKGLVSGDEIIVDGVMKLQQGSPIKVTSFLNKADFSTPQNGGKQG